MTLLTENQLELLMERLLAAKLTAKHLLNPESIEGKVEVSGSSIGRLTRIDAIQMQAMSQLSRGQLAVRLQQIEAALAAFDAGRYGFCNRCQGFIGSDRLEALPEAPLCLSCQEQIEQG